jgi:hypothetical protein
VPAFANDAIKAFAECLKRLKWKILNLEFICASNHHVHDKKNCASGSAYIQLIYGVPISLKCQETLKFADRVNQHIRSRHRFPGVFDLPCRSTRGGGSLF